MFEQLFPTGVSHYLAGGLVMGAAVAFAFVMAGLVTGMSTFFTSTWSFASNLAYFRQERFVSSRAWRLALAAGLVLGGFLFLVTLGRGEPVQTSVTWWQLAAGGFIGGFGARMSGGCTSGHGICGMASIQVPSILAVITFLVTAMIAANLVTMIGGV